MKTRYVMILLVALLICCVGVLSIYSSNSQKDGELWHDIYKRQIIWVALGVALFFMAANFDYRKLWDATYFLYGVVLFLLFLVFLLGIIRLGAQRWLKLIWFNFQPSEVAKFAVVVFLARYFSRKSIGEIGLPAERFGLLKGIILPLIFVAIPMLFIMEQPDLGSSIMLFLVFMCMIFLAGVRLKFIVGMVLVILSACPFFWHFLHDYQRERLMVFLNPNIDPLGAGYTVIQSKIAVGSAGFFGKGWLSGTQSQLHFLPESHTDFIFATFTEEWGVIGGLILLSMYYFLIRQGLTIASSTRDRFASLLAFGITLLLAMQASINIAMNLGLAPVVGIPLPLMSYGGSSVIVTFLSLGFLVNIDKKRAVF